jgi:hypothetical protein
MTILFDGRSSIIGAGPWNGFQLGPWGETSWRMPDNNEVAGRGRGARRCDLITDPLGQRGQIIRSTLLRGDGDAISSLAGSRRSELTQTAVLQNRNVAYWVKFDTLLLSPWSIDPDWKSSFRIHAIAQIHDSPDGSDTGRAPPFEIYAEGPNLVVTCVGALNPLNDNTGQLKRVLWTIPLAQVLDAWQEWVVRVVWDHRSAANGGSPELIVWRNRRRIVQESGTQNCFNDVLGNFPALGIYVPIGWATSPVDRVAYTTGMVIGDSAETFASFTGAPELERVTPVRLALA